MDERKQRWYDMTEETEYDLNVQLEELRKRINELEEENNSLRELAERVD